jgi:hypothetical protein
MGMLRKKECEAKAVAIVERLIEADVEREWLKDAVSCQDCAAPSAAPP